VEHGLDDAGTTPLIGWAATLPAPKSANGIGWPLPSRTYYLGRVLLAARTRQRPSCGLPAPSRRFGATRPEGATDCEVALEAEGLRFSTA